MPMGSPLRPPTSRWLSFVLLVLVSALASLAGCGQSDAKKAATQVAAKVNSDEISVHQINEVLGKLPNLAPENADAAKREILGKLVDRQLAMQQAVEKKLDRTPAVVSAIESARGEILARAYLEQLVSAQPKPTLTEAKTYYGQHPELFAQRRLFNLQEIAIPARPDLAGATRDQVARGRSMPEIAAWLKAADVKFATNSAARAAEQIPLEILPRIHALKDGQTVVLDDARAITIAHVATSQAQPIDEVSALPRIQLFLANKAGNELALRELAALREKAKIEYLGEFETAQPAPPAPKPAPDAKATSDAAATSVGKGMAGLK